MLLSTHSQPLANQRTPRLSRTAAAASPGSRGTKVTWLRITLSKPPAPLVWTPHARLLTAAVPSSTWAVVNSIPSLWWGTLTCVWVRSAIQWRSLLVGSTFKSTSFIFHRFNWTLAAWHNCLVFTYIIYFLITLKNIYLKSDGAYTAISLFLYILRKRISKTFFHLFWQRCFLKNGFSKLQLIIQ